MMPFILLNAMASGNWNSTQSSFSNTIPLSGLIMLIFTICVIMFFALILTSLERYTKVLDTIAKWAHSLLYTLFGVGIIVALDGIYIVINGIIETAKAVAFDPIWIAYAIGAYIVCTVIGWLGAKVFTRAEMMHAAYTENKKDTAEPTSPS